MNASLPWTSWHADLLQLTRRLEEGLAEPVLTRLVEEHFLTGSQGARWVLVGLSDDAVALTYAWVAGTPPSSAGQGFWASGDSTTPGAPTWTRSPVACVTGEQWRAVVPSCRELLANAEALQDVMNGPAILVAVAAHRAEPPAEELAELEALSTLVGFAWPWVLSTQGRGGSSWSRALKPFQALLPVSTVDPQTISDAESFSAYISTFQGPVSELLGLQKSLDVVRVVEERLQRERERMLSRRALAERMAQDADDRGAEERFRAQLDETRGMMEIRLKGVQQELAETRGEGVTRELDLLGALLTRIERLEPADLRLREQGRNFEIDIHPGVISELEKDLQAIHREKARRMIHDAEQSVGQIATEAARRLSELGLSVPEHVDSPPSDRLQDLVTTELRLSPRYKGELARRTLMTRVSEGQRAMMGLSFLLMIGGYFGFSRRNWVVGVVLVAAMAVGVLWSFRKGRTEEEQAMRREVQKARDAIREECLKRAQELVRARQALLNQWVMESLQSMKRRTEQAVRDRQQATRQQTEAGRDEARTRLKRLEGAMRELEDASKTTQRVQREMRDSIRVLRDALQPQRNNRDQRE